jgi:hypothetical protein
MTIDEYHSFCTFYSRRALIAHFPAFSGPLAHSHLHDLSADFQTPPQLSRNEGNRRLSTKSNLGRRY